MLYLCSCWRGEFDGVFFPLSLYIHIQNSYYHCFCQFSRRSPLAACRGRSLHILPAVACRDRHWSSSSCTLPVSRCEISFTRSNRREFAASLLIPKPSCSFWLASVQKLTSSTSFSPGTRPVTWSWKMKFGILYSASRQLYDVILVVGQSKQDEIN